MSTKRLDDLKSRVQKFEALGSEKDKRAKKKECSRKLDALTEKIEVDRICLGILHRVELLADMGIRSLEVMVIDGDFVGRNWPTDLFNDVPLEAIKHPAAYKVYIKLNHMGLRPRFIQDVHGGGTGMFDGDCFRLIVSWGENK